jgi:hypothetical protein
VLLHMSYTVASGSSAYSGACAICASCSRRAFSRSAAHSPELAAAVIKKNMLKGGTNCKKRYTVPYLVVTSARHDAFDLVGLPSILPALLRYKCVPLPAIIAE